MSTGGERCCLECRKWHALELEPGAELDLKLDGAGVHVPMPAIGECRARPPVVFMLAQSAAKLDGKTGVQVNFPAAWPQTRPLQWCDDFSSRSSAAAAWRDHPALKL